MLPPNARAIKKARDAGQHPSEIIIVYSSRWCARQYRPGSVLVLADEYKRGEYSSFAWVSGVPVILLNHDRPLEELATLAADLGRWTAPVLVGPFDNVTDRCLETDDLMFALKCARPDMTWPPQWNDDLERGYAQRRNRYEYIARRSA